MVSAPSHSRFNGHATHCRVSYLTPPRRRSCYHQLVIGVAPFGALAFSNSPGGLVPDASTHGNDDQLCSCRDQSIQALTASSMEAMSTDQEPEAPRSSRMIPFSTRTLPLVNTKMDLLRSVEEMAVQRGNGTLRNTHLQSPAKSESIMYNVSCSTTRPLSGCMAKSQTRTSTPIFPATTPNKQCLMMRMTKAIMTMEYHGEWSFVPINLTHLA